MISSSVVVAGAISTGFWRLSVRIGDQSKSIGRLEGKVGGMDTRLDDFGKRVDNLDRRINSKLKERR